MKRPLFSGGASPWAVAGMALALLLLAALQHRWIGEMAEADRDRLRRGADAAAQQFRNDFNRELRRLARSFDIGPEAIRAHDWQRFVERLEDWRAAGNGYLEVTDLFVREPAEDGGVRVWRLGPDGRSLQEGEMPPEIDRWFPRGQFRGPGGGGGGFRGGFGRAGAAFSAEIPALTFGLFTVDPPEEGGGPPRPSFAGMLGVILSRKSIADALLPELAGRYFGELDQSMYDVAVLQGVDTDAPELVYASRPGLGAEAFADPQVRMPLIWHREEAPQPGRGRGPGGRGGPRGRPPEGRDGRPGPDFNPAEFLFESIVPAGPGGEWMLAVQPAGGSVDAVVARLRRRNLGISLGILALLAAGMGVLLVSSRRAERLARLQMEFVAGVSHELRTPLAVIRSAGDNLAEGVVQAPEQVRDYGKLIRDEGRRLTGMVEQTLQFASTQAGRQVYKVETVPAAEALQRAVDDLRPAVEGAGFTLEQDFEADLPPVRMDVAAASRILQSLVENALKYGGESKWVGIQAASRNGSVDVTVRDKGVGIDSEDLPHIFDPFYRGKRATDAQIHGTGLGLSLAKSAAEGFGGRLRAESKPGQGSAFTLTIPRAEKG